MMSQEYRIDKMAPAEELLRVQGLMPISPEDRARLREGIIGARRVKEKLQGYFDRQGVFRILAGINRWEISRELIDEDPDTWTRRLAKLPIEIVEVEDPIEREEFAIKDNLERRHLSQSQKRNIVDYMLRQNPQSSDRQIAKMSGAAKATVGSRRAQLEQDGVVPRVSAHVGRDGKVYRKKAPAQPAKSAKKSKSAESVLNESVLEILNKAQIDMALQAYAKRTGARGIAALRKTLDSIESNR